MKRNLGINQDPGFYLSFTTLLLWLLILQGSMNCFSRSWSWLLLDIITGNHDIRNLFKSYSIHKYVLMKETYQECYYQSLLHGSLLWRSMIASNDWLLFLLSSLAMTRIACHQLLLRVDKCQWRWSVCVTETQAPGMTFLPSLDLIGFLVMSSSNEMEHKTSNIYFK